MTTIVTHSDKFHADDAFAVATLLLVFPDAQVTRSRDPEVAKVADIVVDTGGTYDPELNRFDHHQAGGAGERLNGVPYSSFGLVWKKFGPKLAGSEEAAERIDRHLVQAIDGPDNGVDVYTSVIPDVHPAIIHSVVSSYRPTWKEDLDIDAQFGACVEWAKSFLHRQIKIQHDLLEAEGIVLNAYKNAKDKRIVVIPELPGGKGIPRELINQTLDKFPEPIYAVGQASTLKAWKVVAITNTDLFSLRKPLPESWRAKENGEFSAAAGIDDGMFCHRNGFVCGVRSRESAIKLAEIALNS